MQPPGLVAHPARANDLHSLCTGFPQLTKVPLDRISASVHCRIPMESDKLYSQQGSITPPSSPPGAERAPSLAERLREFRLDRDLTYYQLAAVCGVSKSTLQRICEGKGGLLNARTLRKLERFLEAARVA